MITGDDNLQNILKLELDLDINNRNCFHEEVYEGQVQFRTRQHKEDNRKNVIYISLTRHVDGMVYLNAMHWKYWIIWEPLMHGNMILTTRMRK